ncbi:MAG TPA: carboxypeptidase-like regulatory domain-containing protein [Thermoanaerobaculia bacterium]|nr:carboxypeptidase-like regulatory domain-containing protein [Thermoanaerobaculia bacterium]
MAIRSEDLNRLTIGTPCPASWEGMQGDRTRRFCAECRRHVFDFERMTPREIRARVEADRGRLCARITRRDGRISVLEEPEPAASTEPASVRTDRRVSSIAATLVTAWLGAGAVHAQESCVPIPSATPPAIAADFGPNGSPGIGTPAGVAILRGRVTEDAGFPLPGVTVNAYRHPNGRAFVAVTDRAGEFRLEGLEAGAYDVEATIEGYEAATRHDLVLAPGGEGQVDLALSASPEDTVTVLTGETALVPKSPSELFAESDLAVKAVTGASTVIERQGEYVHVATDLRIETSYKGGGAGETVAYLHWERLAADGEKIEGSANLASGTEVLAFLDASDEPAGSPGVPAYRSADFYFGVRWLGSAELEACVQEVEALARR